MVIAYDSIPVPHPKLILQLIFLYCHHMIDLDKSSSLSSDIIDFPGREKSEWK